MCFHSGIGKTILFGGVNANPSVPPSAIDNDKTWAYDGTNWVELNVPGVRPLRRERARLAYDLLRTSACSSAACTTRTASRAATRGS
jgi:hypothetical protein